MKKGYPITRGKGLRKLIRWFIAQDAQKYIDRIAEFRRKANATGDIEKYVGAIEEVANSFAGKYCGMNKDRKYGVRVTQLSRHIDYHAADAMDSIIGSEDFLDEKAQREATA
jgi:hypothetical protein